MYLISIKTTWICRFNLWISCGWSIAREGCDEAHTIEAIQWKSPFCMINTTIVTTIHNDNSIQTKLLPFHKYCQWHLEKRPTKTTGASVFAQTHKKYRLKFIGSMCMNWKKGILGHQWIPNGIALDCVCACRYLYFTWFIQYFYGAQVPMPMPTAWQSIQKCQVPVNQALPSGNPHGTHVLHDS